MLPRRIAVLPAPLPGEWFASWVERMRQYLGVSQRDIWRRLGIPGRPVLLTEADLASVSAATGVHVADLEQLTLKRYFRTILTPPLGGHEAGFSWWRVTQLVDLRRCVHCPLCLDADGAIRLEWLLPWMVVCLKHLVYLEAACPECGGPVVHICFRTLRTSSIVGRCKGSCPRRPPVPVTDQRLVSVQEKAIGFIHAEGEVARKDALAAFYTLRVYADLALFFGDPRTLIGADDHVRDRFAAFAQQRNIPAGTASDSGLRNWRLAQIRFDIALVAALMRIGIENSDVLTVGQVERRRAVYGYKELDGPRIVKRKTVLDYRTQPVLLAPAWVTDERTVGG